MFNKVRQGKELLEARSQLKKLQKQMAEVTETVEIGDVTVKVSADQKVIYIKKGEEQEDDIVRAINEANKKVQKKAAMKMAREGDLDISSLLGGMK